MGSAAMFLLSGLGMIDIASGSHSGGLLGEVLSTPLVSLFDNYASIIFLGGILIISILIIFDAKLDIASLFGKLWIFITRKKEKLDSSLESIDVKEENEEGEEQIQTAEEAEVPPGEEESVGKKIKKALGMNKEEDEEELPI